MPEGINLISETTGRRSALLALAADIKLSHSVFALPFALLGAFIAFDFNGGWTSLGILLALIVLCMVCARTFAMLSNRLLDRDLDAANPRTSDRALPSRRARVRDAIVALCWSAAVFLVVTTVFGFAFDNWWPLLLAFPVLGWIGAYPLLKRWTWLCHLYLGVSLAISPLAAAAAVRPEAIGSSWAIWLLALGVMCWVAGFDVLYALQDLDVDRAQGLKSIPIRFGVAGALWISRLLHVLCVLALTGLWLVDQRLGLAFAGGILIVMVLLIVEHRVTSRGTTRRIQFAFFTLNGIISVLLGALGIISIIMHQQT